MEDFNFLTDFVWRRGFRWFGRCHRFVGAGWCHRLARLSSGGDRLLNRGGGGDLFCDFDGSGILWPTSSLFVCFFYILFDGNLTKGGTKVKQLKFSIFHQDKC